MEDTDFNLLRRYPLISKNVEENAIIYRGSIEVNDEDYKIVITKSKNNSFKIALSGELRSLEAELNTVINDLHPKNILTIMDHLQLFLASKMSCSKPVNHCDIYKHVIYEYSEFTKFYLNLKSCYLAEDLSKIRISTVDEQNREHFFEVSVNFEGNKDIFKIQTCDLPLDEEDSSSDLRVLYNKFLGAIEVLQPFFELMDYFDKNCWVLDPVEPKRNVSRIPDIKFLGPERLVEEYRTTVNENLENWDSQGSICLEILKLLGMDNFPQKSAEDEPGTNILKESGECSICFSLRLDEKLPEIVCKNKFCENYYHTECLYEVMFLVFEYFNETAVLHCYY
ncbi:hypothetical protein NQ314_007328 [Rhamnusium bicolor]|uniref:RING-type domain-containing protein n=1 Tax=Rhamnusium bicolor TaxID=1586634 RepID=A0AAV8YPX2_9CUCU|nr:hypothetical protein NQ314_007328 [Rhamnusium bicolor]